ncbi:MAG TPA: hypothetical protein VGL35_05070 [Rhizomicrobium sp.]|jgi:hypothetical protein
MRPGLSDRTRRDVPSLDCEIHDLLKHRAELDAAEADGARVPAPLRAAQTARILRTILSRHSGNFPPRALVHIWSDILFASDRQTTLHVFAGEDASGFRDLARVHFGSMLPIVSHMSTTAIMHACADDRSALGIVPPPESVESGQAWWEQLAPLGHPGPRIAQFLPFLRNDPSPMPLPQGYVIGTIEQESTGHDTTLLRLECHAGASRARLQSLLRQAGFHAQILAGSREAAMTVATRLLVANKGFVAADDERLPTLAKLAGEAIESVALVGGYADPVETACPA